MVAPGLGLLTYIFLAVHAEGLDLLNDLLILLSVHSGRGSDLLDLLSDRVE